MSAQRKVIEETICELQETLDLFYQQKSGAALKKLDVVLGKLAEAMDALFTYKAEHDDFVLDEAKLTNSLTEAMEALQAGDHVLLADLLQYDFLEYLQELIEQIN